MEEDTRINLDVILKRLLRRSASRLFSGEPSLSFSRGVHGCVVGVSCPALTLAKNFLRKHDMTVAAVVLMINSLLLLLLL